MRASTQSGLSENAAGAIAYITFIPAIVFLMMPPYNGSSYVRFHAWQSLFLCVAAFLVNIFLDMIMILTVFMAPFTLLTTSASFSCCVANRSSTWSKIPPASPARTIFT